MRITFTHLNDEVRQFRKVYPKLKNDSAFVLWFLRAFLEDSEEKTLKALTGEGGDKNIDAVLVDERSKQVHLVQGKFHFGFSEFAEKRNDVLHFADLANYPWADKATLDEFFNKMSPLAREAFQNAIHYLKRNKYELRLFYITTGRCSDSIRREAKQIVNQAQGFSEIYILDGDQIATLYGDYLMGVSPAVPELSLKIASDGLVQSEGVIRRFDPQTKIESWVFSMRADDVGQLYGKTGIKLFARNIRGFLGSSSEINKAMATTVRKEPGNFWYFNNGVTLICDKARREMQSGEDVLIVERPQVINGQQTTRTLHQSPSARANVLVKVVKIPREPGDEDRFDDLVSSIVRATNWQNAIKQSDLISNDAVQVFIERELRKRGYQYLRKRQTKSEARISGGANLIQIRKEQLAQAVACCEFDPAVALKGKEVLFDVNYYRSIFGSRSMSFYLPRYWLTHMVLCGARGRPSHAYAKWLVAHFLWSQLSSQFSNQEERRFRHVCENWYRYEKVLKFFYKAIEFIFKAALTFHVKKCGRAQDAMDRQTFFKQPGLHIEFQKYWTSPENRHRLRAQKALKQFDAGLCMVEIDD